MATIRPGEVFYDRLPDGRYERCVLQPTTDETPDRHTAARGGTGEFYRAVPIAGLSKDRIENADEIIMDVELGMFVVLEREP